MSPAPEPWASAGPAKIAGGLRVLLADADKGNYDYARVPVGFLRRLAELMEEPDGSG